LNEEWNAIFGATVMLMCMFGIAAVIEWLKGLL
jgi:hypothetical protein